MRRLSITPSALSGPIHRRIFTLKKTLYQSCKFRRSPQKILFIVGCQRSGTTLMRDVFARDLNTKIYGEFSKLSSNDPRGIRLNPLPSVKGELDKDRAAFVVIKPLVESQNISTLLHFFDNSKALWMYRHYKDVASSNVHKFGPTKGIEDLRPIVENTPGNWRSERVPERTRRIVRDHFSERMNPNDAAVLFWFVRNSLFFDLEMDKNPHILLCRYEDLVSSPMETVRSIYDRVGQEFPGEGIVRQIHSKSLKKGKDIRISEDIEALAKGLLDRLDKHKAELALKQ